MTRGSRPATCDPDGRVAPGLQVLCAGPTAGWITGQRVAFENAAAAFNEGERCIVCTGGEGLAWHRKIVLALAAAMGILRWRMRVRRRHTSLAAYTTLSRSWSGLLRDTPFVFALWLLRVPIVNHVHGADFRRFYAGLGPVGQALVKWLYRRVHTHIVLLERMREQLDGVVSTPVEVIPNAVEPAPYGLPERVIDWRPGHLRAVFLSNLIPEKGVVEAAQGALEAAHQGVSVELVIAGSCASRTLLEKIRKLESGGAVHYLGQVASDDKWRLLLDADVLVLPTYYEMEAFPLVLIEAMQAGCGIICTDHNYLKDIVAAEGTLFVDKRSTPSVAQAFVRLGNEPGLLKRMQRHNQVAGQQYQMDIYRRRIREVVSVAAAAASRKAV